MSGSVSVRMYNVGFGDAFVVTVRRGGATWRLLLDCGVHSHGSARPIAQTVRAIIDDLRADSPDGIPRLDVVAATHRHADHISGFAVDDWEAVEVTEVWLPFVADPDDPDARRLRHTETAQRLHELVEQRTLGLDRGAWPSALAAADWFAVNSLGNAAAMDRLLGRNGAHFATVPRVRFLPDRQAPDAALPLDAVGAAVHVLAPGRDPEQLRRMDPPKHAGWLELDLDHALPSDDVDRLPLFDPVFTVADPAERLSDALRQAVRSLNLRKLTDDEEVLAAASILERAVNNTSLFLVLDVAGTRLIFPGDAQYGPWRHILDTPHKRALLADAAFYKVGHHGSHNATPPEFVHDVWAEGGHAMLPFRLVKRWQETIPKRELLEALAARHHTVIRADAPTPIPGSVEVHDDLWSELTLPTA